MNEFWECYHNLLLHDQIEKKPFHMKSNIENFHIFLLPKNSTCHHEDI